MYDRETDYAQNYLEIFKLNSNLMKRYVEELNERNALLREVLMME